MIIVLQFDYKIQTLSTSLQNSRIIFKLIFKQNIQKLRQNILYLELKEIKCLITDKNLTCFVGILLLSRAKPNLRILVKVGGLQVGHGF
jgi:hypothetical protein